jgi:hypothetical protein
MKILNTDFPLRLTRLEHGTIESFGNYFKQKTVQLMTIILITFAVFYLSGYINKGIDKLHKIAPKALQELNADD